MLSSLQIAKRKKLLRKSEQAKGNSRRGDVDRATNSKADDQDLVSVQAVYQSESESEESLSGDDREEIPDISEVAIQNVIIEDSATEEAITQVVVEENIKFCEEPEDNKEAVQQNSSASVPNKQYFSPENESNLPIEQINQEIDEDKSSAALSTLRKLKFKKVLLMTFLSMFLTISS